MITYTWQAQPKTTSHKYIPQKDRGSGFLIDPVRGARQNGYSESRSAMHPSAVGSSWNKTVGSTRNKPETSQWHQETSVILHLWLLFIYFLYGQKLLFILK